MSSQTHSVQLKKKAEKYTKMQANNKNELFLKECRQ